MKRLFTLSALLLFFAYPLCAQGGRSGAIVKAGKAALSHKPILELPKIQTHPHFTLSNGITTSVVPNLSNVTAAPTAGLTATTLSNLPGATAAKPTVAPQGPSFRNRQMERFAAPISPEQSARITQTLIRRVQTSGALFERARANSPQISPHFSSLRWGPGKTLSQDLKTPPEILYPQVPYLQDQEQLGLYLLARNNREQAKWYPRIAALYQEINRRLDDFKQDQTLITHPREKDIAWVAEQLPEDISYLLLGECHYLPDMPKHVADLISYIHRVLQPEREIIVLTEFLQEGVKWGTPGPVTTWEIYVDLFKQLHAMDIPVIGMESSLKFNDSSSEIVGEKPETATVSFIANISKETDSKELDTSRQVGSSLEGIRFRNERFLEMIKQVRQEHPNALLIIYTGLGHVEYSEPYSLGDALAGPTTRVVSLGPAPIQTEDGWNVAGISFDVATNMQFVFDRLTQFNDPELIKLSGADIRWRIPIIQGVK